MFFRGMFGGRFSAFFRAAIIFFGFFAFKFDRDFIAETKTLFPTFHFVAGLLSCFFRFAEIEN